MYVIDIRFASLGLDCFWCWEISVFFFFSFVSWVGLYAASAWGIGKCSPAGEGTHSFKGAWWLSEHGRTHAVSDTGTAQHSTARICSSSEKMEERNRGREEDTPTHTSDCSEDGLETGLEVLLCFLSWRNWELHRREEIHGLKERERKDSRHRLTPPTLLGVLAP